MWSVCWRIYYSLFYKNIPINYNVKAGTIQHKTTKSGTYGGRYTPEYVCPNLKWRERDVLLTYIDKLNCEELDAHREKWLENHNVINFIMINNQCKGTKLSKSFKEYKTISEKTFEAFAEEKKIETIISVRRVT